jgi:hypothetical protein
MSGHHATDAIEAACGMGGDAVCMAGWCAPGLLARGRLPGTGEAASGPANQAIGVVAAVGLTSCKVPAGVGAVPGSAAGTTTAGAG